MKLITEKKDCYKLEVKVNVSSFFIENLKCSFNELILVNEDGEKKVFNKNQVQFIPEKIVDGFKVTIYIVNEGDEYSNRIDYLIDEDYEIETLDVELLNITNNEHYDYILNSNIGEQVIGVDIECNVSDETKSAIGFLCSNDLDESENTGSMYLELLKNKQEYIDTINAISNIKII